MNKNQLKGNWQQIKRSAQTRWTKLTREDLVDVQGEYSQLVERIQDRYGLAREDAQREIDEWLAELETV